jgi:CubicO group peptidase (beta-lactamase class C family)
MAYRMETNDVLDSATCSLRTFAMPLPRLFNAIVAASLASLAAGAVTLRAQTTDSISAVDRLFQWANAKTPGCAVGVARNGNTLVSRAYGMANLSVHAPYSAETVSDAGSVSKQFTAGAVMLLVQDGKIALDDDIRRYLPEMPDYGTPILIRHLLSHTSGIRESDFLSTLSGWSVADAAYTNAEILDMAARQKALNFRPGSEFEYSNTNFTLAAIIVERVSGTTLAVFTKRRLFDPIGMSKTEWRAKPPRVIDGMATGYQTSGQGLISETMWQDYTNGPGGLRTTVTDLLKWNEALTNGTVISKPLVTLMETPVHLSSGGRTRYGFGLSVGTYNGLSEIQHGGIWAGYRSFVTRYPEQALSVAVMCNDRARDAAGLAHQVADLFLPRNTTPTAVSVNSKPAQLSQEQLNAGAGLYRMAKAQAPVRLTIKDGGWESSGDENFGGGMLVPESATTFRFGDAVSGEFRLDSRGQIQGFRMWVRRPWADTISYERVQEWNPTAEDTSSVVGRYTSSETGTLVIAVRDKRFAVAARPTRWMSATAAYRDALEIPGFGMLLFLRDPHGKISGLTFTTLTARGIEYMKQ